MARGVVREFRILVRGDFPDLPCARLRVGADGQPFSRRTRPGYFSNSRRDRAGFHRLSIPLNRRPALTPPRRRLRCPVMRLFGLLGLWVVVACSGSDGQLFGAGREPASDAGMGGGGEPGTGGSAAVCSTGDTRECVGPGACRGAQACEANAWSACDCGVQQNTGGTQLGAGGIRASGGALAASGGHAVFDSGLPGTGGHISGLPPCDSSQKECSGVCVSPIPELGCATSSCSACPSPEVAGASSCSPSGECDFNCPSGYTKTPVSCEAPNTNMTNVECGARGSCGSAPNCRACCLDANTFTCGCLVGSPQRCIAQTFT